MDVNSFDIEFFNFENASEEEIKEIHAILKGPGNNGLVELPWVTTLEQNCTESLSAKEKESVEEKTDVKSTLGSMVGPALQFTTPQAHVSPTVEAFIAPPTSVGPYPNPPYIVSRTIPYLRAYPPMGMPFFACPIPGNTRDSLTSPYGQYVSVVPTTIAQEKFVGTIDSEFNQKSRPIERQYNRRSKKKPSSDYSFESETAADTYPALDEAGSSTVSSNRPTTVPIVPLPVPSSTLGVAGGTIPLHTYPPGLHTLPYPQVTGPQAPSAAMYYVPFFNHPYSSYLPSASAPMMLPANLPPDADSLPVNSTCENAAADDTALEKSNCEEPKEAKNASEGETDCNSSSDYPNSKSMSSSPDYSIAGLITDDFYSNKCVSHNEDTKRSSRCWADLFKKPRAEINGIDHQLRHVNTLDKPYTNGNASASDASVH